MAKQIKAFCLAAQVEHYINVEQYVYDMWSDPTSPLYQPKPRGHGGQLECAEHRSWAFLPGATPAQIITPPHVAQSGIGRWNERGGFYESPPT